MMTSVFKIAEVKKYLRQNPECIVVPPDFDAYAELILSGVDKDRVKPLVSITATGEKCFLIMYAHQYDFYKREEDKILAKAGDTIGQHNDSRNADTKASE